MSIFLYIPGIAGEASDAGHQGWIDIEEFSTGTLRAVTSQTSTQGDRESSNAITQDFKLVKRMDRASPAMFIDSCCMRGKEMKIHIAKTGQGLMGADVYMEYILRHAIISEYTVQGAGDSILRPREIITISYTDIDAKYTPYSEDGIAMSNIAVGFNTATNTKK